MEPVVYDFAINERGTEARLLERNAALMPAATIPLDSGAGQNGHPPAARRPQSRTGQPRHCVAAERRDASRGRERIDVLLPRSAGAAGEQSRTLNELLPELGFDSSEHEQIRADLRRGRIGLAQNRLPASADIRDVEDGDVWHAEDGASVTGTSEWRLCTRGAWP